MYIKHNTNYVNRKLEVKLAKDSQRNDISVIFDPKKTNKNSINNLDEVYKKTGKAFYSIDKQSNIDLLCELDIIINESSEFMLSDLFKLIDHRVSKVIINYYKTTFPIVSNKAESVHIKLKNLRRKLLKHAI